jgi:sugar phosphate isomerase/epimerase
MPVERFLGGAWTSVHGPGDPLSLPGWVLDAGFRGFVPGPGPRPIDWRAVDAARRNMPMRIPAVRAASPLGVPSGTSGLASTRDGEQRAAAQVVGDAVSLATDLGTRIVILDVGLVPVIGDVGNEDLGDPTYRWTTDAAHALTARAKAVRNPALDRVCRALFAFSRSYPEIRLALTPGRSLRSIADRAGLEAIFEDLASLSLGYWHDAAVAARRQQVLGEAQGEWVDCFRNRLVGMTLGDASGDGMYLPPGAGGVDWSLLANYVPSSAKPLPAAIELDPSVHPGELPGVRSFLDKFGL